MELDDIASILSSSLNYGEDEVKEWVRRVYLRIGEDIILDGSVYIKELGVIEKEILASHPVSYSESSFKLVSPKEVIRFNPAAKKDYDLFYDVAVTELFLEKDIASRFSHAMHRLIEKTLQNNGKFHIEGIGIFERVSSDKIIFEPSEWIEKVLAIPLGTQESVMVLKSLDADRVNDDDDMAVFPFGGEINEHTYQEVDDVDFGVLSVKPISESYKDVEEVKAFKEVDKHAGTENPPYAGAAFEDDYYDRIGKAAPPPPPPVTDDEEDDEETNDLWKKIVIWIVVLFGIVAIVIILLITDTLSCFDNRPTTEQQAAPPVPKQKVEENIAKPEPPPKVEEVSVKETVVKKRQPKKKKEVPKVAVEPTAKPTKTVTEAEEEQEEEVVQQEIITNKEGLSQFDYEGSYWTIVLFSSTDRSEVDKVLREKMGVIPAPYNNELYVIFRTEAGKQVISLCLGGYKKDAKRKAQILMNGLIERKYVDPAQTKLYFVN